MAEWLPCGLGKQCSSMVKAASLGSSKFACGLVPDTVPVVNVARAIAWRLSKQCSSMPA